MKKETIFGLIALALLPWFALIIGCSDSNAPKLEANGEDQVQQGASGKITDFTYVRTVKDQTEFELTAKSAVFFSIENRVALVKTKVVFFGKNGQKLFLSADKGEVRTESADMLAQGNVVVKTDAGYRVTTEALLYKAKSKLIHTDRHVQIESETMIMTGVGLELPVEEQTLELKENVKAFLNR